MQKIPITVEGAERLKAELSNLKREQRPKIIKDIATARAHGDLKENAEYHAAREKQGLVEARIKNIEATLSNAQVIDISQITNNGKVIFGSTVELCNLNNQQVVSYQIVGEDEADITVNKISVSSPLIRSIIGKMIGDEVTVDTPGGKVSYEIINVAY